MENKVLQAHIEVGQVKIWRERGEQDRVWTCQVGEGRQKAEEDIRSLEDRGNHLAKVKGKLEQSLDEAEDALEREKKSKGGECQNFIMWFNEITVAVQMCRSSSVRWRATSS